MAKKSPIASKTNWISSGNLLGVLWILLQSRQLKKHEKFEELYLCIKDSEIWRANQNTLLAFWDFRIAENEFEAFLDDCFNSFQIPTAD
jgi:hypothetical protein